MTGRICVIGLGFMPMGVALVDYHNMDICFFAVNNIIDKSMPH